MTYREGVTEDHPIGPVRLMLIKIGSLGVVDCTEIREKINLIVTVGLFI